LVQLDTLDIHPVPYRRCKQFTAHDVVSRTAVLELHERATARTARMALDAVVERMPFPVKAIQIDGGSEFMAEFEEACRDRGILLFVLPPRSPKLNGCVERGNRTHTEEFYEWTTASPTVAGLTPALREWERIYNTIRPHQALGYLTPAQFLANLNSQRKEVLSPR
jgi:transposase InsO family protein